MLNRIHLRQLPAVFLCLTVNLSYAQSPRMKAMPAVPAARSSGYDSRGFGEQALAGAAVNFISFALKPVFRSRRMAVQGLLVKYAAVGTLALITYGVMPWRLPPPRPVPGRVEKPAPARVKFPDELAQEELQSALVGAKLSQVVDRLYASSMIPASFGMSREDLQGAVGAEKRLIDAQRIDYVAEAQGGMFHIEFLGPDRHPHYQVNARQIPFLKQTSADLFLHEAVHLTSSQPALIEKVYKAGSALVRLLIPYYDANLYFKRPSPQLIIPLSPSELKRRWKGLSAAAKFANGFWDPDAFRRNSRLAALGQEVIRASAALELPAYYTGSAMRYLLARDQGRNPVQVILDQLKPVAEKIRPGFSPEAYIAAFRNREFTPGTLGGILISDYTLMTAFQPGEMTPAFEDAALRIALLSNPALARIVEAFARRPVADGGYNPDYTTNVFQFRIDNDPLIHSQFYAWLRNLLGRPYLAQTRPSPRIPRRLAIDA